MQVKSDVIRIKRKTLLYFVIAILTLGIATPVFADYLGPDRTTTESSVETYDYGVWASTEDKSCNPSLGEACIQCSWERDPYTASCAIKPTTSTYYWYKLGTKSEVVETTVNLPPATISSSLQNCTLNNGWCVTVPELLLSGNEPLSGYTILAIEGSLNGHPSTGSGQAFACSGSTCNVPLSEGDNTFTFWALSSYGDSSTMGTFTAKVDTVSPNVGLDVNGSTGTGNWYVSPTTLTATGSDSTSGLSSALLSVNGGAWTSSTTLNDGVYSIDVRAEDNAGNISASSTTISVDTTTPSIDLSITGTTGSNGWYSSNMQVTASASDLTSGISSLEVSTDGGAYQAYTSPISFTDGHHTIQFKATDNAGNQTETPVQEFYVDTNAPTIEIPKSWEVGETITNDVQDYGSGLSALRVVIEDEDEKYAKVAWDEVVSGSSFNGEITWDGKFADGTTAPPGEYLVWIKATDKAGNERFGLGRVIVPEPNSLFTLFKPETTSTENLTPPKELTDPTDALTIAPVTTSTSSNSTTSTGLSASFGGLTTTQKESTTQSLALASGVTSSSSTTNSNVLWGATAAAMIGATMAYALEEKRKRREEEAKELEEAYAKAAKLNAAEEQRKINGWLEGQAMLNAYIEELEQRGENYDPEDPLHGQIEAQIESLKKQATTQGLGAALDRAAGFSQWLTEQEAGENQLLIQAEAQRELRAAQEAARRQALAEQEAARQRALEEFRAGEQDTSASDAWVQSQEQPSFWEDPLGWFQETPLYADVIEPYVVQPVQEAITPITTTTPAENTPVHTPHVAKITPAPKEEKSWWEKGKDFVEEKIVQPVSVYVQATQGGGKLAAPISYEPSWWQKLQEIKEKLQKVFHHNAYGQDLIEPATEDEIMAFPDIAAMRTYIAAAINVQRDGINYEGDNNSHLGPAQLSRNELNADYRMGFECENDKQKNCR